MRRCAWMIVGLLVLAHTASESPAQSKKDAPKLPPGTKTERNIAYVTNGHERQVLDLAVPPADKPMPLVVWIHGGGWVGGHKENPPNAAMLAKGYAIASINYRYSTQAVFPAQIHDCKAAIRWLRANAKKYGYDPDRIGVWGASAGGHLVALLGTSGDVKDVEGNLGTTNVSSRVQAVCDVFGPTDILKFVEHQGSEDAFKSSSLLSKLLGGPPPEKKELAKLASPVTFISKDDPPFLILQGDKDPLVPYQQSEEFHAELKKVGVDSTLIMVKGGGHGPGIFVPENINKTYEFFDRCLKK